MTQMPVGWVSVPLGTAVELLIDHRGQTPGKLGGEFTGTGVPVVSAIHIKNGRLDFAQRERYVSQEMADRWMPQRLRADDVLLTSEAPLGSVALVPSNEPLVLSQRLFALRGRAGFLENRYLYWALQSPAITDQLRARSSGSTVSGIRQSELRQVQIPLPRIEEQLRIVDVLEDHLSRLDKAHAYLRTSITRTEQLASTELWHLTHGLPSTRRHRLDEIAEVRLGRQRSPANHNGPRMRHYLRAGNVTWNALRLEDVKEMNFTESEETTYRLVPGDILVVEASGSAREVGKSAIYDGAPELACFQNTLVRVRCFAAESAFVQKYLLAEALAGRFMANARGVGINHLGRTNLAAWPIAVPPEGEQNRLANLCEGALERAVRLEAALDECGKRGATLRSAVLAAAFSGRLTGHSTDSERIEELAGV